MQVNFEFSVGQSVKINMNKLAGTVRGNYIGTADERKVDVEYADSAGIIHTRWFLEPDLTAV